MAESSFTKPYSKSRPRSKAFLRIDLNNAYARLGVSPLAPPEEIASRLADLRGKAIRKLKAKATRSIGEDDEAVYRLDLIDEEIGKPKARKKYDENHPQNILLTVQPSPAERAWLGYRKAGLISEWLLDDLGQDAFLPCLRCLQLWSPNGLDNHLLLFLAQFTTEGIPTAAAAQQSAFLAEEDHGLRVSPDDLERLTKE